VCVCARAWCASTLNNPIVTCVTPQSSSFHCDTVRSILLADIDPSLAFGFYCADRREFDAFWEEATEVGLHTGAGAGPPVVAPDSPRAQISRMKMPVFTVAERAVRFDAEETGGDRDGYAHRRARVRPVAVFLTLRSRVQGVGRWIARCFRKCEARRGGERRRRVCAFVMNSEWRGGWKMDLCAPFSSSSLRLSRG
jgi:hypothetical protein